MNMSTCEHSSPQFGHSQPSFLSPPLSPPPDFEPRPPPLLLEYGVFDESPSELNVLPASFENVLWIFGRITARIYLLVQPGGTEREICTGTLTALPSIEPARNNKPNFYSVPTQNLQFYYIELSETGKIKQTNIKWIFIHMCDWLDMPMWCIWIQRFINIWDISPSNISNHYIFCLNPFN